MASQIANTVNKLCQQIKKLNKKYYLFITLNSDVTLTPKEAIPFNSIIVSKGIDYDTTSSEIVIKSPGIYRVNFIVFIEPRNTIINDKVVLTINGVEYDESATSNYMDISTTFNGALTLMNTVLMDVNKDDRIALINDSRNGAGIGLLLNVTTSYLNNSAIPNMVIEKL